MTSEQAAVLGSPLAQSEEPASLLKVCAVFSALSSSAGPLRILGSSSLAPGVEPRDKVGCLWFHFGVKPDPEAVEQLD